MLKQIGRKIAVKPLKNPFGEGLKPLSENLKAV